MDADHPLQGVKIARRYTINDAKSDSRFPDVNTLAALTSYLYRRGAPYQAIEAAERLWQKYEGSRKPQLLV